MTAAVEPTQLVTAKQIAAWTGLHLSTVYELADTGELRAVRIGRSVRFRVADYEAFITERLAS